MSPGLTDRIPDKRRYTRKRKEQCGYEDKPPTCRECASYMPPIYLKETGIKHFHSWCDKNKFNVSPGGVCDCWQSKTGETLEAK